LISASGGAVNLSGSTIGPAGAGGATSDGVTEALAAAEAPVVLSTADGVGLVPVVGWTVAVVDGVLVDETLVVVVADTESLGVISAVVGTGSDGRTDSVTIGANVSGGYSVAVAVADSLAVSVGSYGGSSARAGTVPAENAVKEIAAAEASATAAPRDKPMRRGAFILAQPPPARGVAGPLIEGWGHSGIRVRVDTYSFLHRRPALGSRDARDESRANELSAPEEIRTPNLLIRSQMLYPLSYGRLSYSVVWPTSQPRRRREDLNLRSPLRATTH
jgi:hypothetical protein